MKRAEFTALLKAGLGRPVVYARGNDVGAFRDAILDACLHCCCYDPQVEGTYARYMYDLVAQLPENEFYHNAVLNSLKDCGDNWDAVQRFHFGACMARNGNEKAIQVMYEAYDPGPNRGEQIGVNFLQVDGVKGLLFVAGKLGELLGGKAEGVNGAYLLGESWEICGRRSTMDALRDAGTTDACIERFRLAAVKANEAQNCESTVKPETAFLTYSELLNRRLKPTFHMLSMWGLRASDSELTQAANGLIAAKTSDVQLTHLRIFLRRPFALDVGALLNLVDIEENRVGFAAVAALAQVSDPRVRACAFRMVNSRSPSRRGAIELLAANYVDDDCTTALRWFQEEDHPETLHNLGMDLVDFWTRHPDDETELLMLRLLYEKGPCGFWPRECRPTPNRTGCLARGITGRVCVGREQRHSRFGSLAALRHRMAAGIS